MRVTIYSSAIGAGVLSLEYKATERPEHFANRVSQAVRSLTEVEDLVKGMEEGRE